MKKILFSLLTAVVIFTACKSQKTAIEFNDKIVAINKGFYEKGQVFGTALKTALATKDFSKLGPQCDEMVVVVNDGIAKLNAMENVSGSEELKEQALNYFKFEKTLIDKAFVPFKSMNATTSDEEIKTATDNLMTAAKDENNYLEKVRLAQNEYAKKNGFTIKPQ